MEDFNFKVCLVGLGLIGSSYGKALKNIGAREIVGIDINEETLQYAINKGIIDRGYKEAKKALEGAHLVIISIYPEATEKFILENMEHFEKNAVITDCAGIKSNMIDNIQSTLRKDIDFVGGHPMAGKEGSGIENSCSNIFIDSNYIITPTDKNKKESIKLIENLAKALGCKNISKVTPSEHDKIIAYTSHLPHILAVELINSDILENETKRFIAGSFKDATRVADINSELWSELFIQNKIHLINQIEEFERGLQNIKNAINNEDIITIKNELNKSRIRKREMI